MGEHEQTNIQKFENYREQFKRLKKAMTNGFYLEAIFIEYAIMEDRTESLLRHAGKWEAYLKHLRGRDQSLTTKINYFKKIAEEKKSLPHKYFSDTLLDEIITWKEDRNKLIHALIKQPLTTEYLQKMAQDGQTLVDKLRNRANSYKRAVERHKTKNIENNK